MIGSGPGAAESPPPATRPSPLTDAARQLSSSAAQTGGRSGVRREKSWRGGSGPPAAAIGALSGCGDHLSKGSSLTLDDRRRSPRLLGRADCCLYLDAHPVQVGEQGSVLLPDRPIRKSLLMEELGEPVAAAVKLCQS